MGNCVQQDQVVLIPDWIGDADDCELLRLSCLVDELVEQASDPAFDIVAALKKPLKHGLSHSTAVELVTRA